MATTKRARAPKSSSTTARKPETQDVAKVTTQTVDITEAIRTRAYQIFEQRGYQHGRDFDDWLRAEHEVQQHFGMSA